MMCCDSFQVMYDVGQTAKFEAVLMENEQALVYCEKVVELAFP